MTADQTPPGPERIAQMFHEAYERLAPSFAYETREASAKPWAEVPENNRRLMTAVVAEVSDALVEEVKARVLTTADYAHVDWSTWRPIDQTPPATPDNRPRLPLAELKAEVLPAVEAGTFVVVMPLFAGIIGGLSRERADEIADALNQTMEATEAHGAAALQEARDQVERLTT